MTSHKNVFNVQLKFLLHSVFSLITSNTSYMGKIFKNGPNKICERHPLKDLKQYDLLCRP